MILESGQVFISELFPNPAQNEVYLSTQFEADTEIRVAFYNAIGQEVLARKINAQSGRQDHSFDISRLSQGTYLVTVQAEGQSFTRKLIVD
jgi:hypothetical protein